MKTIAVIGSGVAGLACAKRLKQAGLSPVVFDKGRNIGGRLATRVTRSGLQFDHGAQYIRAKTEIFSQVLAEAERAGMVGTWRLQQSDRRVGVPGMRGLAQYLGSGLDVHQNAKVLALSEVGDGSELTIEGTGRRFDCIVSTVPAPQAMDLVGCDHPNFADLAMVKFHPCWTLMVKFEPHVLTHFTAVRDPKEHLSWIALDSSKPARVSANCWVAQAGPDWSRAHLEMDPDDIAEKLLELFCMRTGFSATDCVYNIAHRWRYAAVAKPLGKPFLNNEAKTLYFGGDWSLEARVEAAWTSGTAIAEDILQSHSRAIQP